MRHEQKNTFTNHQNLTSIWNKEEMNIQIRKEPSATKILSSFDKLVILIEVGKTEAVFGGALWNRCS